MGGSKITPGDNGWLCAERKQRFCAKENPVHCSVCHLEVETPYPFHAFTCLAPDPGITGALWGFYWEFVASLGCPTAVCLCAHQCSADALLGQVRWPQASSAFSEHPSNTFSISWHISWLLKFCGTPQNVLCQSDKNCIILILFILGGYCHVVSCNFLIWH